MNRYKNFDTSVVAPVSLRDVVERRQANQEAAKEVEAAEIKKLEEENKKLSAQVPFERDERFSQDLIVALPVSEEELEQSEAAQKLVGTMVAQQADAFVKANPGYHVCPHNFNTIASFLAAQGVTNPTKEAFQAAYDILTTDGRIVEKPLEERQGHIAIDPATNEKRVYSDEEIEHMDSATYAKAFGLRYTRSWGR